jgi:hypothetical protein
MHKNIIQGAKKTEMQKDKSAAKTKSMVGIGLTCA